MQRFGRGGPRRVVFTVDLHPAVINHDPVTITGAADNHPIAVTVDHRPVSPGGAIGLLGAVGNH